jgi:hypothetical protein
MPVMIIITIVRVTHKNEGKNIMLETSRERVKLLKAGISTRTIEQLYLQSNCIKIIGIPVIFNVLDIMQENRAGTNFCEVSAAYVNA